MSMIYDFEQFRFLGKHFEATIVCIWTIRYSYTYLLIFNMFSSPYIIRYPKKTLRSLVNLP